jgi:hypothetical protein
VAFLVGEDGGDHVGGDWVVVAAGLDDLDVVVDRALLGLDDAADDGGDVGGVGGGLEAPLDGLEVEAAGYPAVELLDPAGELLGVGELLGDVGRQRLLDLLGADAVEVDGVGDVALHGLELHPIGLSEQSDDLVALRFVADDGHGGVLPGLSAGTVCAVVSCRRAQYGRQLTDDQRGG